MIRLIIANILFCISINSFADCEKGGAFGHPDISIPVKHTLSVKANEFKSSYLICRTKAPIPTGNRIEFNFNNGSYTQIIDHDYFTFRTPLIHLLNDGEFDYITVSINLNPGWPSKYSYECDYFYCK